MDSLRKFFKTENELEVQLIGLKYAGLLPLSKVQKILFSLFKICCIIMTMLVIFFESTFVYYNFTNIVVATEALSAIVVQIITLVILPTLWYYNERIFKMINEIKDLAVKWQFTEWSSITSKSNKFDQRVMKFLMINMISTSFMYVLSPAVKDLLSFYLYGKEPSYKMPFNSAFFYDIKKSPAYELSYISFIWAVYTSSTLHFTANSIFFGCSLNLSAHFEILRKIIHEVEMKEFIEYHREIINLTKELNKIYRNIILAVHLFLGTVICTIGFQIVVDQNNEILQTIGLAVTAIMELFIYSYGGQLIMDKSTDVCKEVYNLDKNYQFIMMRSQKEVKIKAGFFHASLTTLASILNSVGSMMALLKSFI